MERLVGRLRPENECAFSTVCAGTGAASIAAAAAVAKASFLIVLSCELSATPDRTHQRGWAGTNTGSNSQRRAISP